MKIRSGFVSNSSSSSFVVVASQETIDKTLTELNDLGKALVKTEILNNAEKTTINGAVVLIANGTNDSECFGDDAVSMLGETPGYDSEKYWELMEDVQEQWCIFLDKVKENGGYAADRC